MTQLVVGAIIVDSFAHPTRVLAARRSKPAELRGKWEFPGGKVEADETPQQALVRELQEELAVEIRVGDDLGHTWPIDEGLELELFFVEVTSGDLTPGEAHDAVRWLARDDLDSVTWLPTDEEAVAALRPMMES